MVERIRTLLETRQLTPTQFADAIGIARPIVSHILSGRNKPSLEVVQRILAAMPDISMPWLLNGSGAMLAAAAAPAAIAVQPLPQPMPPVQVESPVATKETINLPRVSTSTSGAESPSSAAANVRNRQITKDSAAVQSPLVLGAGLGTGPGHPVAAGNRPTPRRFAPATLKASSERTTPSEPVPVAESPIPDTMTASPVAEAPIAPVGIHDAAEAPRQAASISDAAAFFGGEKPIRRIVIFYRDGSFADYQPE